MKEYFAFQWHITDECDQRCKHCYIFSENNCKHLDAMTWEQIQETFYNCMDFCEVYGRLPYFYITGGDPILHPDFWRLLALLKEHDIPFAILGNPFHLTDEVCMRLKGYGCRKYQLSLDGMRETHDWFRKPGSFDCTLEKIGCINRAGIRSVVMTTVSGANISEVPDIIDTVVKAGADVYAFARYCPTSGEKDTGIGSVVFALKPGDGSAREQAASCQRVLGGCANIAAEYATKRYRSNVVNWGMLPFILDDAKNSGIQAGDVVVVRGIRKALLDGKTDEIPAELISGGSRRELTLSLPKLTADERDIILAGCLINYYAK